MREWLIGLTRPEDHLLWAWVTIIVGYAAVGATLGLRARRSGARRAPGPAPDASAPES